MFDQFEHVLFGMLSVADYTESIYEKLNYPDLMENLSSDSYIDLEEYRTMFVIEIDDIFSDTILLILNECIKISYEANEQFNSNDISIELELRLGSYLGTKFIPGVNKHVYNEIISSYRVRGYSQLDSITEDTIVRCDRELYPKSSIKITKSSRSSEESCIEKKKLEQYTFKLKDSDIAFRLSVCIESLVNTPINRDVMLIRKKDRVSFEKDIFQIDVTKVESNNIYNDNNITYEVELELFQNILKDVTNNTNVERLSEDLLKELEYIVGFI
eukprot:TRINITY_DN6472_c0_g2_i1.p1 TRINITY_DN6472_c0_g2~~TRINITY_DN6472_c0_g2_i1.p1  ORF type:complete len:272 (+),score=44.92 TRINITY_DN6472_c0_g2_i1:30-845(+)